MRKFFGFLGAVVAAPYYILFHFYEYCFDVVRYYRNALFRRADLQLFRRYLFRNPYQMCEQYVRPMPDDRVQRSYGETFLGTFEVIARKIGLSREDTLYELGCGRGRGVFWFHALFGCRSIGVEINPAFVETANQIREALDCPGVEFRCANLLDLDYSDASVLYFYGTDFPDAALDALSETFRSLTPGTLVVSVTNPVADADGNVGALEIVDEFNAPFLWGETRITIQRMGREPIRGRS